jgi:hypothetical protein
MERREEAEGEAYPGRHSMQYLNAINDVGIELTTPHAAGRRLGRLWDLRGKYGDIVGKKGKKLV